MADRHDDVDSWLGERIDPLLPPPGTFELIKRRARRRKYRRLAITATSAAMIVAAAVTVPQVVNLPVLNPSSGPAAAAGRASSATATGGGRVQSSSSALQPSVRAAPSSPAAAVPAAVPANFRPTSATFIGTQTGWVIGQAGTPGHCATRYCTSVARTDDAGKTWSGVPAPVTGPADGATGVSQIRFLNLNDGWAFGPELWVTHNGGHSWTRLSTNGMRVTDLETVGGRAFALFASCTGRGAAFGAACTSFTLYSSPASAASSAAGSWTPVGASTSGLTDGAPGEAASVVLTGGRGFLLAPGGDLYAGPVDGSGAWTLVNSITPSCPVGSAQGDGQPAGALFGAVNARELILTCATVRSGSGGSGSGSGAGGPGSGAGGQKKLVFSSPNGGASWIPVAEAPTAGIAASVAASPTETIVLGTNRGIDVLPAGAIAWQTANLSAPAPPGGFSYVGMTTDTQGIALPANPASGTVWFTFDGGQNWRPSPLSGS